MSGFVAERIKSSSASGATPSFSLSGVTPGNHLLLEIAVGVPGTGNNQVSSVTDDKGNTYQIDVTLAATNVGSHRGLSLVSAWIDPGLGAPTSITVHLTQSGAIGVKCEEISGLDPTTWFDVGATLRAAATTSLVTASVTPAGAGEVAVAAFSPSIGEASFTPGSGYTQAGTPRGATQEVIFAYELSAAAGLQSASGTVPSAGATEYLSALAFYLPVQPVVDSGRNTQTVTPAKVKEARSDAATTSAAFAGAGSELIAEAGKHSFAVLRGTAISAEFVADAGRDTLAVTQQLREARHDMGRSSLTGAQVGAAAQHDFGLNVLYVIDQLGVIVDAGLNTLTGIAAAAAEAVGEQARTGLVLVTGSPFALPPWTDAGTNTLTIEVPVPETRPVPPKIDVPPFLATLGILLLEHRPDVTPPEPADLDAGFCALWYDPDNQVIVILGRTFDDKILRGSIPLDLDSTQTP